MSGQTEAISPPDIVFKGKDGDECEAFVVAIRDFAFATGRDGDHSWMLRFATTRLRGRALRWHARLDPSIKTDWDLFVQALFDEYPLVEDASVAEIATPVWSTTTFSPGPSTATLPLNPEANQSATRSRVPIVPSAQTGQEKSHASYLSNEHTLSARQYDASSTGQQIGLLRIIRADVEGTSIPQYVWWDYNENDSSNVNRTMGTINRHEALVVSFLPSSALHTIGCLNSRARFKTLALEWVPSPAQERYVILGCTYGYKTVTQAATASGPVANAWSFLKDGSLQASLSSFSYNSETRKDEETKFTTTEVHVDVSGTDLRFVKPGALLEQDKPGSKVIHPFVRARIVFEPL